MFQKCDRMMTREDNVGRLRKILAEYGVSKERGDGPSHKALPPRGCFPLSQCSLERDSGVWSAVCVCKVKCIYGARFF